MTDKLELNPDLDWRQVRWGRPEHQQSWDCSLCGRHIDEDEVPLRMWKNDGSAAVFCSVCAEDVFTVKREDQDG